MVADIIGRRRRKDQAFSTGRCQAAALGPAQRRSLSLKALAGSDSISGLARDNGVSRKFLYQQKAKASEALAEAFAPPEAEDRVLFHLPVTQGWIQQFVLAQVLIGHTSFRGVMEILDAVFDYHRLSLGSIHNLVKGAAEKAARINQAEDLTAIAVGAHDEIYQAGQPVLVGVDVRSTYCYLLAAAEHCDETTWGVHLLELAERGLHPQYTIADGGRPLRAGQAAAWGELPCHGDVFHAERELSSLAYYLENRAAGCTHTRQKLEQKMKRLKKHGKGNRLSKTLALARQDEARAVALARDVHILADWMKEDILSMAGPDLAARRELFDFVTDELTQCEPLCPHRIRPVRRKLQKQRDQLLAFAGVLDERLADLAARLRVPLPVVHGVCELQGLDPNRPAYRQRRDWLRQELPLSFHAVQAVVRNVLAETPRASSIVENLNSRLRSYFFLRRDIRQGYLELLQFFLNHRRYLRSVRPERVGKSPAELLHAQPHRHWLELLGYQRFSRN
jgi:hypothetical protein